MERIKPTAADLEYVNCNFCHCDLYTEVYREGILSVVRCNKCGLAYTNPRPLKSWVLKNRTWQQHHYSEDYQIFKGTVDLIKIYKPNGLLLDVGCGNGLLLNTAKKEGFDVIGIETNVEIAEFVKNNYNIRVEEHSLEDIKFENDTFDIITLFDVLEHLPDPMRTLSECYRISKPDGLLFLKVLNIYEFYLHRFLLWRALRRLLRPKTYFDSIDLQAFDHIYHFSTCTIKNMLIKSGFRCIRTHIMNRGVPRHIFRLPKLDMPRQILKYALFYLSGERLDLFMPIVITARK